MTEMDLNDFKTAMSRWASSVAVVCTVDEQERLIGFTATSFTSVSLDPPLVLFCLGAESTRTATFDKSRHFTVNFLSAGQQALAGRFAEQGSPDYSDVPTVPGTRSIPLLEGCMAYLECDLNARYAAGDHHIYVCRVRETLLRQEAPLVYFMRDYHRLEP